MTHQHSLSSEIRKCIQECLNCYSSCVETMNHCLEMGEEHAEKQHIASLQICADVCQVSARSMLLGSDLHMLTCRMCAEVCRSCAEDCESMAQDDETMRACAEACRRCEQSCLEMSRSQTMNSQETTIQTM